MGAGPVNVTVAVDGDPPLTALGLRVTLLIPTAPTVRARVAVELSVPVAVMFTATFEVCAKVVIGNVAVVAPAATVTDAGTVAADVVFDAKVTV